MASLNCFRPSRKKGNKGVKHVSLYDKEKNLNTLHVKLDHLQTSSDATELRSSSFSVAVPFRMPGSSRCKVKVMNHESPVAGDPCEVAYEGEDEHDETPRLERDSEINFQAPSENLNAGEGHKIQGSKSYSSLDIDDGEFDFQTCFGNQNEEKKSPSLREVNSSCSLYIDDENENSNTEVMFDMNASGHVSDPGMEKAKFWASPQLKRSCSNLAMRSVSLELEDPLLVSKCKSYEDMQRLAELHAADHPARDGAASPGSVRTRCSADKVILKKHSSSNILPSGSRKVWWKLFLWSHRNLHRTAGTQPLLSEAEAAPINQQGGYSSDTVEPKHATGSRQLRSPSSITEDSAERGKRSMDDKNWDGFFGFQNQWVAFPPDLTPLWRVDEWVKDASSQPPCQGDKDDHHSEEDIAFPLSPENGASPPRGSTHLSRPSVLDDVSHANTVIRSLNSNSSAAHITGLGLAAIPSISLFSSLRSVNLSGNLIVQITPGSLPKGLHVLNLSRNKMSTIEGLRELTRLRVLDLSYNRISRIAQGLSNCTLIKELYLAGNKISMVEGLHRLLKLTVLDLSFNKITTAKAFGQLVANYNSLIAVNLLGNPIQSNMSDDLLRKTLCSLLPKLALINKQPINQQKAREIRADANAKAALGNSGLNTRRKVVRKAAAPGTSSSHSIRRSGASTSQRNKHRVRSHSRHHSTLKDNA